MKNPFLDPHLVRFGILGLVFVARAIAATNRKRRTQNRSIAPPQSGPLSSSLDGSQPSPQVNSSMSPQSKPSLSPQAPPSMSNQAKAKSKAPDSPWSDLK